MKKFLVALLALSSSAFAITSPVLKGSYDLAENTTEYAKKMGIKGVLNVAITTEVSEATLKFKGFRKDTYCVEYNEDGIPHHPETRSCAKEETSWTPEVMMEVKNFVINMNINEVKLQDKIPKTIVLNDKCIGNMDAVKIISEVEPTEVPVIVLADDCKAAVYTRFERLNVKPKILKGHNMEAVFDLQIFISFNHETTELLDVKIEPMRSGLASLGKYNTKIFKYYGTTKFEK